MADADARGRFSAWIKQNQHVIGVRQALDCLEIAYQLALRPRSDDRPAIAGGRRARLVPFASPRPFTRAERRELMRAVRAQNTSFFDGGAVARFESAAARRFGARHAIAVSSGTAALHAALAAVGVGPGDEVVVPALAYVSDAMVVRHLGATPRFVDADAATWNLDAAAVEAAVTDRTRAILAVHLCGVPCDMERLGEIARRRGLHVVEDAAQAHGSRWSGRQAGTIGALGCFSFQSAKTLATGEGGVVLTDDDELARRARLAMNLGETRGGGRPSLDAGCDGAASRYDYDVLGWNHRLGALAAAVGVAQLARLDSIRAARARNAQRLRAGLAESGLVVQAVPDGADPCWSSVFALLPDAAERDGLARALAAERIDVRRPYDRPLPRHALFADPRPFPVAERVCRSAIGFRVDPSLGAREMEATIWAVRRGLAWADRRVDARA
jgi:perosamine synthetase